MTPCFQFGIVHYFTKVGSGEYYLEELEDEPCPLVSQRLFPESFHKIRFVDNFTAPAAV